MEDDVPGSKPPRKSKPLPPPRPGFIPTGNIINLWERQLHVTEGGQLRKNAHNIVMLLTSEQEWRGAIGYDAFAERIVLRRACPVGGPGPWTDTYGFEAALWLQASRWRLDAAPDTVANAIPSIAQRNTFHPLRDRLNALTWDGTPRVDTWLTAYLGAEDTPVTRAIASTWLLGACSRAFSPGSQVDAALVLEGVQGAGKSSALRAMSLGFFSDELADIGSKDAAMQLHGTWIVELGELDALSRADITRVKSFITRRVDKFRAPYGRTVGEHPRSCVFSGTTNQSDYLRDETGNRRWLPARCGKIRLSELQNDAEQVWAEALCRYRLGERTYITDGIVLEALGVHTAERYQGDIWTDVVLGYAQVRESVSVAECLEHVGVERGRWTLSDQTRVAKILKANGYDRHQRGSKKERTWRYRLLGAGVMVSEVVDNNV